MPSTLPILRARRERRLAKQHASDSRKRSLFVSAGMILSLAIAALIIVTAFAYVSLTRDLPSIQTLPILLNPPNGLLLQPTKIYDRAREHVLFTFAPAFGAIQPRRYIFLSDADSQRLPQSLADAVIATSDPNFYDHAGYDLTTITNYELHDTLAQRLVSDLLLFNEPPSFRRALRERILAAQITSQFGRAQILEWYLNSAHFGRYAFGAESAAQLYFGKSAAQLSTAESAILAAVSDSPSLNPHDAPQTAIERGHETIRKMSTLGFLSDEATANALGESPFFQPPPPPDVQPAAAFVNLLLAQLDSQFPRARIERGGLTIVSTLDFDVQQQASCVSAFYAARLAGLHDPSIQCDSLRFLSALPPSITIPDSSASAIVTDPQRGQVLAAVGETFGGRETPLIGAHKPGSALDALIYLTGFTRGLSPASLIWDIPGKTDVQNFDGAYHGPMRLRTALANDYPAPAAQVAAQMGAESIDNVMSSFGVTRGAELSLLDAASVYGVFAEQGALFGQDINGKIVSTTILKVEDNAGGLWLDWTTPQAKPIVSPALAYLVNRSLSDLSARAERSSALNVGRPVAVKLGQTADALDAWTIGYSPLRVVAAWVGSRESSPLLQEGSRNREAHISVELWNALMQIASQNLPMEDWLLPAGVSAAAVCDPSGMLPTSDCPNVTQEVFLQGNEPVQADTMYRTYAINHETGLLATVFTLPQLIEERTYLVVPPEARAWAESAGVAIPPTAYDVIQLPPPNPDVNIVFPELFAEVSGMVQISGTAAGADFASYRVLVGRGLNPQEWIEVGRGDAPVEDDLLVEWNTAGLSGLYAVQLQTVRTDQRVETAVIQVTIK